MAKRVLTGCRDCKKCSISGFGKTGRGAGRSLAFLATAGMSELAMAGTKDCGACGHALSLHEEKKVTGWKQAQGEATAGPKPKPTNAAGSFRFSASVDQIWDAVVGSYEPGQIKKQDPAKRKVTIAVKQPGTPAMGGTITVAQSIDDTAKLDYDISPSFGSLISAGEDTGKIARLDAAMRAEAERMVLRVESILGRSLSRVDPVAIDPVLTPAHAAPSGGGDDLATQFQKLADLYSQGVLSADEFAAAKARLLG